MSTPARQLRVLLADGRTTRLDDVAGVIARLGHVVVATETDVGRVGPRTEAEAVDVAIVVVGESGEHALALIGSIVHEALCPVIAVLDVEDAAFVRQAARRGVFAYITNGQAGEDQFASAIEIVLHRFAEYHDLAGAFGRRALVERAKGILMERHGLNEEAAFKLLRLHARNSGRKIVDVALAVIEARELLPERPE